MRFILSLVVFFALVASFGCGSDAKVIPPENIPPKPNRLPGAGEPPGGGKAGNNKGDAIPPVKP